MSDNRMPKRGLGRGLSALMGEMQAQPQAEAPTARRGGEQMVPIEFLRPNPNQPRRRFVEEQLAELAASIREKGVLQPLIVRPEPGSDHRFEIIAGERRWRAAQQAQLHEVPVIVRSFTDEEALQVGLIENIQRADLNPVEEAEAYQQLVDKFGHTQDQVARSLSKSRSHIANLLRLLQLPPEVQAMVRNGTLSNGHARALITAENPLDLARIVVARGLSVRATEKLAGKARSGNGQRKRSQGQGKDADTLALEGDLSATLKMAVAIDHQADSGGGSLSIRYASLEELDDLCKLLSGGIPR